MAVRPGRRTILGTLWLVASNAVRFGLQLAMLPLLARLLGPDSYGLVALAMPIVFFAMIVSDGGFGSALVRDQEASPAFESTVFWLTAGIGVALSGLTWLAAGPVSALVGQPEVGPVLAALSPILLLSALCTVPSARISREGRFWAFGAGDVASALGGAGVAVWAALEGWGAWALVAQQLTLWGLKLAVVTAVAPPRLRLVFHARRLRASAAFGAQLMGSGIVAFFARNLDSLLIGTLLGTQALGFYAMAFQIMRLPEGLISGPVYTALFPAFSRTSADHARAAAIHAHAMRLIALLVAPAMFGLAALSDLAVRVVLGEQWAPTGAVLAILAPAGLVLGLTPINAALLIGFGRSDLQLRMTVLGTALTVAAIAAGAWFGIVGVAVGLACAMWLALVPYTRMALGLVGGSFRALARFLALPLLAAAAMAGAVLALRAGGLLDGLPPAGQLVAGVGAGAAVYGALLLAAGGRRMVRESLSHIH